MSGKEGCTLRVLGLASYPEQAAATRYRLMQYTKLLADHGIELIVRPFMDSDTFANLYRREAVFRNTLGLLKATAKRIVHLLETSQADLLLVQREAMMFGPPIFEWVSTKIMQCPMVLDLDDATYVRYVSPTYGKLASALKWFSKTDDLIRWSELVICGNRSIAEYVTNKGKRAVIVPTVVDMDRFRPAEKRNDVPVIGWIGTHSTFPYLESIFPVLQKLARSHPFRLKVIGSGRKTLDLPGVEVENYDWKLEREVADLQSFDIGLYPIKNDDWATGKSGFKAIQYMAVGIPYVVSPVGACTEIGEPNVTHFCATTEDEWYQALARLMEDRELRLRMGRAGRAHAERYYALPDQAAKLAHALESAAKDRLR